MLDQHFESQQLTLDGEHLKGRFAEAGFVDIKVFKKRQTVGEHSGGLSTDLEIAYVTRFERGTVRTHIYRGAGT